MMLVNAHGVKDAVATLVPAVDVMQMLVDAGLSYADAQ